MYSDKDDITNQIPLDDLIGLSDDDDLGVVNDIVLNRAISDADATIDAYCQGRYQVPLASAPDKIRQISVDLAIYNLFARASMDAPEIRKERQREAIRFLEKVAAGTLLLGTSVISQESSGNSVDLTSSTRIFSRDKMSGY